MDFLPFALPDIGQEEIDEVVDSLQSGWLTTGPKTKKFEGDFAKYLGEDIETVAVNSATAGLHLVLEALGISVGDEVITTTYTFTATAEVIRYLGADPVFVDIDPNTLNIDVNQIEEKITSRTKAIIPVHFAGLACDMDAVIKIARKYGLAVVEDAAHALPSTYKGKKIGTLETDATVFSFYATKTLATGEGGMIATKNKDIAQRCRIMRLHGIDRDVFNRYVSDKPAWYYEVVAPGYKYNMTDIAASIGLHQLKKVDFFQRKREHMAEVYDKNLQEMPLQLPPRPLNGDIASWHLYVIRLEKGLKISRDEFINSMAKKGIGCSVHFIPLHMHPYWKRRYNFENEYFPVASDVFYRVVSLPIYTKMTEADQERVIKAVKEVLNYA